MSTEPFIGEIKILGFNFSPRGYETCQGQIISIAQNTALFSLLGTNYGGNGQTTFALPDLQGRVPIGQGQNPGFPNYTLGESSGRPSTTLSLLNLPQHVHTLNSAIVKVKASTNNADEISPDGTFPATTTATTYTASATPDVFTGGTVISGTTDSAGMSSPIDIMNPYLTLNYSIAMEGIFPSRN